MTKRLRTRLQLWKSTSWQCPNCKSKEFWIEVESRVSLLANSPFTSELVKRVRIVCKNCGKRFENSELLKKEN